MAIGAAGGGRLVARLREIAANLERPAELRVGFLADAKYPDGKSVASIAAQNEFGATIEREAGQATVFRKLNAEGTGFLRGGRFVRRSQSNFSTTHATPAYTIVIPPRPFFRRMIKANKASWPGDIAKLLKPQGYDGAKVLRLMGEKIVGQLRQSIHDFTDPRNAPSTIRRKGLDKPLIESGVMYNSADYEVNT